MSANHRGTFGIPGPRWFKVLVLLAIPVEWAVWRVTGFQLPGARWG